MPISKKAKSNKNPKVKDINIALHLFKQNFKFSSAHFLIFDEKHAEKLHGHNYQVQVEVGFAKASEGLEKGYFVDFKHLKDMIKARLDLWDEHVLLPELHPDMKTGQSNKSLEVKFRDRFYVFPRNEVILLPVNNTSVEQLSLLLVQALSEDFKDLELDFIRVRVEETAGQAASAKVRYKQS